MAIFTATTLDVSVRLLERALIELGTNPVDQRKIAVQLTNVGKVLVEQTTSAVARINESTVSKRNDVERVPMLHLVRERNQEAFREERRQLETSS
jgi:DNA-binding MarR family transcriptional regulator